MRKKKKKAGNSRAEGADGGECNWGEPQKTIGANRVGRLWNKPWWEVGSTKWSLSKQHSKCCRESCEDGT